MSLPKFEVQGSLFESLEWAAADLFDDKDKYKVFARKIWPLLASCREELAECYEPGNGRPGIEPVVLLGVLIFQFFGTCAGSASGRVSEISSGLEAGFKSEDRGRRIPPDKLGAFPATFGGSWKERLGAAGRVGGIRTRRFNRQAFPATLGLDAYSGSSRSAERPGMYA